MGRCEAHHQDPDRGRQDHGPGALGQHQAASGQRAGRRGAAVDLRAGMHAGSFSIQNTKPITGIRNMSSEKVGALKSALSAGRSTCSGKGAHLLLEDKPNF